MEDFEVLFGFSVNVVEARLHVIVNSVGGVPTVSIEVEKLEGEGHFLAAQLNRAPLEALHGSSEEMHYKLELRQESTGLLWPPDPGYAQVFACHLTQVLLSRGCGDTAVITPHASTAWEHELYEGKLSCERTAGIRKVFMCTTALIGSLQDLAPETKKSFEGAIYTAEGVGVATQSPALAAILREHARNPVPPWQMLMSNEANASTLIEPLVRGGAVSPGRGLRLQRAQ